MRGSKVSSIKYCIKVHLLQATEVALEAHVLSQFI